LLSALHLRSPSWLLRVSCFHFLFSFPKC
jgi:hypothetical protein